MTPDPTTYRRDDVWIDISVPLDPDRTPVWPGSPAISLERRLSLSRGDSINDTTISCSVHSGTHVDAPSHFFEEGATVDDLSLDALIGPCEVIELVGKGVLGERQLEERLPRVPERLLLKTENSERWSEEFQPDFTGLTVEAARWLAEGGVKLLGIDYLSIQPFDGDDDVHRHLLSASVVLLEGIDLSGIDPGAYDLFCLPVKLAGVEAAPARAILRPAAVDREMR